MEVYFLMSKSAELATVRNSIENRARTMMSYHSQSTSYPSQLSPSNVQLVADVIIAPPVLLKDHNL